MPFCKLLEMDDHLVRYRWDSGLGKVSDEGEFVWESISEIEVFKRDLFSYDLICLVLHQGNGEIVEIDEEDPLWDAFLREIPLRLEGALPWNEWFQVVAFPAFATNSRTIYARHEPK